MKFGYLWICYVHINQLCYGIKQLYGICKKKIPFQYLSVSSGASALFEQVVLCFLSDYVFIYYLVLVSDENSLPKLNYQQQNISLSHFSMCQF